MATKRFILLLALLFVPVVSAVDFTENFESFLITGINPQTKPDRDWYNYAEGTDVGNVATAPEIIGGTKSFFMDADSSTTLSSNFARFSLEIPTQLTATTFWVDGETIADNGIGSQQYIQLQSQSPVRTIVEFYLFCRDGANPTGCELRVRFDHLDTIGQVLVPTSNGDDRFKIELTFDWLVPEFCIEVDDIPDGCFKMLELPQDFGRIQFKQFRADVPMAITFDDWTVFGAVSGSASTVAGDAATGLQNWATAINFTSSVSLFLLGLFLFVALMAAVIVPMFALGKSNAIAPSVSFYGILAALWLVNIEFWPDWIGILAIILTSAFIGLIVRRVALGIQDATSDAGLVAGSLGYFIIASSLLGFSGYAAETITLPTGQPEDDGTTDVNATAGEQGWVTATLECIVSGGVFTFGLKGDCSKKTTGKTWKKLTDGISAIFNWARTAFDFLFQLLTFSLPIPVIFNMMIILPPAAALAVVGIKAIRG